MFINKYFLFITNKKPEKIKIESRFLDYYNINLQKNC